ncbi:MAG: 16S rRNA (uracil(1498)-N(3))-methyltransferase [Candidatus Omnitrophica bacterium]|nr:16S rRNA (uracil(1498)-N(3))-methyltransferase [Candidatus Omnitrophota bacterium]
MNLILLFPSDFVSSDTVSLTGRRLKHVLEILKPRINDTLTVGQENGRIGTGLVVNIDDRALTLQVSLTAAPPSKLPVVLCIALMRPIVLKRVLLTAASMGVEQIILFHSRQVEKSFWQSSSLEPEDIREQLILGLEQAKDTVLPEVSFQKRFKPFVEDVLPSLMKGREGFVADPSGDSIVGKSRGEFKGGHGGPPVHAVVVIGPEGGFISYEVEKFRQAGCKVVGLGNRILKIETAMVVMLSNFFY